MRLAAGGSLESWKTGRTAASGLPASPGLGICNLEKFDWRSGFFNESHQDPMDAI